MSAESFNFRFFVGSMTDGALVAEFDPREDGVMGNANWNFDRDEMEDVEAVKSASNIAGTLRCACTVAPGC